MLTNNNTVCLFTFWQCSPACTGDSAHAAGNDQRLVTPAAAAAAAAATPHWQQQQQQHRHRHQQQQRQQQIKARHTAAIAKLNISATHIYTDAGGGCGSSGQQMAGCCCATHHHV